MAKAKSSGVWAWLKDEANRKVLAWIGAGLVAVAGGAWTVYLHFAEENPATATSVNQSAKTGDNGTAINVGRDVTINPKTEQPDSKSLQTGSVQQKAEAGKDGVAINVGRDVKINK